MSHKDLGVPVMMFLLEIVRLRTKPAQKDEAGTPKGKTRAKVKFKTVSELLNRPWLVPTLYLTAPDKLVLLLRVRVGIQSFTKAGITIETANLQGCFKD